MTAYGATESNIEAKLSAKDDSQDDFALPQVCMEKCAPYFAEFIGTFMIVFTMGCQHICGDPMWNPTGCAFTVAVAIYAFCPVSGGHLNPAVTLALASVGKFPIAKCLGYMIAQTAGAFVGAVGYSAIFSQAVRMGPPEKAMGATGFAWYDVAGVEMLYTFMYVFVFMNCVASKRNNKEGDQNHFYGLAIGFVYIAGGYPALGISGAIFNPAASLAMGTTYGSYHWVAVYVLAQAVGAWLASLVFAIVRPEDFHMQYDGALEDFEVPVRAKLFSEFIGTFVIVLTVGLNLVMTSPAVPWSSAATYMSLIYSLGDVSGAHFNPAVTLAAMLSRRELCSIALGQMYWWNQFLAAGCAGLVFARFEIIEKTKNMSLQPVGSYGWYEVGMAETIFTGILGFAFLATATTTMAPSTTKTNFFFGWTVSSVIFIGGFAIGALSGGMLNPAVCLGRGVSHAVSLATFAKSERHYQRLLHVLWFGLFELGGGVLSALFFAFTHQKEYQKDGSNYPHIP